MSIDNNSQCVRSKYFVTKPDMDESLSDFQEAKQSCKGPKPVTKAPTTKTRKVKVTKRIKGQKDIRTALKGKKNELVAYTKEFDNVCKKSGVDVDSEQLALAIALSKSLQTDSNEPESTSTSSQQRVAKIRKTLQEYGFKVPDAKITAVKKTKKHKKQYKLLTTSVEEKHQIVTSKYTQVLFENFDKSSTEENSSCNQDLEARVFHIASNIVYECMKDDCIFYVDDLVEKSSTNGALLRDWSEIPGRPISPKLEEPIKMAFKDIDCSQNELDIILSGSIKSVKDILAPKYKELENNAPSIVIDDGDNVNNKMDSSVISIDDNYEVEAINKSPFDKAFGISPIKRIGGKTPVKRLFVDESCTNDVIEIVSPIKAKVESDNAKDNENKLKVTEQYRSVSPDIFDDELSSIIDVSKPMNILSQEHKTKVFSQDNFMDLTQCANVLSQNSEKSTLLSQDVTKRRSNDFMEITECIVGSSQPIREEFKEIDLTQSPEANNTIKERNNSINVNKVSVNICNDVEQGTSDSVSQNVTDEQNVTVVPNEKNDLDKENIDLTQSSNEEDKGKEVVDNNNETQSKKDGESINLTQSSNSDDLDELPSVNFGDIHAQTSLDDTIIVDPEEYISNGKVKESILFEHKAQSPVFDLTQEQEAGSDTSPVLSKDNEPCTSFYEDFVHEHSESDLSREVERNNVQEEDNNSVSKEETDDIDLTQSSDASEEISCPIERKDSVPNNSSLGKNGDISIDYDEIATEDNSYNTESLKGNMETDSRTQIDDPSTSKDVNPIEILDDQDEDLNSSQNSEVFHISDKELDYSLHKSKFEYPKDNFDFGGISVLDNITRLDGTRNLSEVGQRISAINENMIDSLPDIRFGNEHDREIDKSEVHVNMDISSEEFQDVIANTNGVINVRTPNKSEYVIKTCDVTPMADYASMSTPERNRELDKYGLKPFKRKRAVKILTHLYNQMHPTVQQLVDEDQPSCKKPRLTKESTPTKLAKSPSKSTQNRPKPSPLKVQNGVAHCSHTNSSELERDRRILSAPTSKADERSSELCAYEVSNDLPVVKEIDCNPDDWVFQKREKAKVHSCRVPLHIAFHNYVLSRRSLREAILKYEPVNIDVIHKDLVGYGHRYDPKELLKFLDKKCITVKTTDNNGRNNRK